jgi:branched-subunit amino acid transport protein AzlD
MGGAGLTAAWREHRHERWAVWAERGGETARAGERGGWARFGPAEVGKERFSFFPFLFLFLFLFFISFSFEQIFSYIFLGVKNILCEVLLIIVVYAYDEMSYEVGSRGLELLTLGLNFGMLQTYPTERNLALEIQTGFEKR